MTTRWFFGFFLVSGFCSLVYQVVWLRLGMAAFGVTTPMVSRPQQPIPATTAVELSGRTPARAAMDMEEWEPGSTPESHFAGILSREIPLDAVINGAPGGAPTLTDDRPVNEYYLLRSMRGRR